MCGIAGIINFNGRLDSQRKLLISMLDTMIARGPDGSGDWISSDATTLFGHRLLSITGRGNNAQPMAIHHEGFDYAITYNGELYNFKEIRKKLAVAGQICTTTSDTEVVLRSYVLWGNAFTTRLNGEFAFAIYDGKKKTVLLVRDGTGVKPLFYCRLRDGTFLFASEPKALLCHPGVTPSINPDAVGEYLLLSNLLTNGSVAPNQSWFAGIHSLEPGHCGILAENEFICSRYWDFPFVSRREQDSVKFVSDMKSKLSAAIKRRLPDEVKFGTLLSGGIDSSIVTAIAVRERGPIDAVVIRFPSGSNPDYEHARLVADHLALQLHSPPISAETLLQLMPSFIHAMDEPHDTVRQLGLFHSYAVLRGLGCKVVLIGEASDEINLGYYRIYPGFAQDIRSDFSADTLREVLTARIPFVSSLLNSAFTQQIDFDAIITRIIERYYTACPSDDPIDRMQFLYIRKFLKYRLDANDRCGLAHGIEARVPFLDPLVIKASLQVPHRLNLADNTEKKILRDAFRELLPPVIVQRDKFALPESEEITLPEGIAIKLRERINTSPNELWDIVSKERFAELATTSPLSLGGVNDGEAAAGWNNQPRLTLLKHGFFMLTFAEWFQNRLLRA